MEYNKNVESLLKKGDINFTLNKVNSFSKKVKPLIIYEDSLLNKFNALDDNIGKSAIYRWVHKINNKSYVGSSKDLYRRLREYYNINFLKRRVLTSNSRIYRALLNEGYGSFILEILEYCDKNILIEREQYYIDLIKPEYNIQSIAGLVLSPRGNTTIVINKKNGSIKVYTSMYAAAKDINIKYSTIVYYANKDKLLKNTYLVKTYKKKRQ
jgi:GIY-YIG catalytic domain